MTVFKKTVSAVAVCAAFLASTHAMAANDLTLKVTGTIAPAACTPALSGNGEVAFGSIATSVIDTVESGNELVQLGSKTITATISCEAGATVGFKFTDNRADSAFGLSDTAYLANAGANMSNIISSSFSFGLGLASNNAKIGAYSVVADTTNATADGDEVNVISIDEDMTWRQSVQSGMMGNGTRIVTVAAPGTLIPKLFTELSLPLKITAGVQAKSVLGGDTITLDGNATVTMVYL